MDKAEFEQRLSEVAVLKEVKIAREPEGARSTDTDPLVELVIDKVLPESQSCEFCKNSCSGHLTHTRSTKTQLWKTTCVTCKKNINLETRTVIEPDQGVNYVAKGLRVAAPGKKLGRPALEKKAWWNEGNEVATDTRSAAERSADFLDRLAAMRNK